MKLQIRPMTQEEQKYSYQQSQQLMMQCGGIGYLRGDFAKSGTEFHTTWFDYNTSRKTDEFKEEFDAIINALRSNEYGVLKSRSSMDKYGYAHKESAFEGNYCKEYGFRADTEQYAYLIRCNPNVGDYNFYVFPYEAKWLDRNIEKAQQGIRFITPNYKELFRIPDGDKIRITLNDGEQLERVCRYIDDYHLEVGSNLYHICEFAERMEQAGNSVIPLRSALPEQCYSTLPSTGEVIILKRGETGYYKTDVPFTDKANAKEIVDEHNSLLGVDKAQEEAMKAGSIFGWQAPAANPKNYDSHGSPIGNTDFQESQDEEIPMIQAP